MNEFLVSAHQIDVKIIGINYKMLFNFGTIVRSHMYELENQIRVTYSESSRVHCEMDHNQRYYWGKSMDVDTCFRSEFTE